MISILLVQDVTMISSHSVLTNTDVNIAHAPVPVCISSSGWSTLNLQNNITKRLKGDLVRLVGTWMWYECGRYCTRYIRRVSKKFVASPRNSSRLKEGICVRGKTLSGLILFGVG